MADQLREAAPDGIDVYFDNVGGDHLEAALATLRKWGRAALCGAISEYESTDPTPGPSNLFQATANNLTLRGFRGSAYQHRLPDVTRELGGWLAEGRLHYRSTIIDGLERAPEALMRVLSGDTTGKALVRVPKRRHSPSTLSTVPVTKPLPGPSRKSTASSSSTPAAASHWRARQQELRKLLGVLTELRRHLGREEPGGHRVDANSVASPLRRQLPRQTDDARLGRDVGGVRDLPDRAQAHERRDVDDRAPASSVAHSLCREARQRERGGQVELEHVRERLGRHAQRRGAVSVPALLTSPSSLPCRSITPSMSRSRSAWSVTSQTTGSALGSPASAPRGARHVARP